jgi:hypothetical protein
MNLGWRGFVWAGAAATMLGVVTQRLVGGTSPVSLPLAIGLTLAVAVTLDVGGRALMAQRHRRMLPSTWRAGADRPASGTAPSRRSTAGESRASGDDWESLAVVCGAVSPAGIRWLRTNTFVTPWLDSNARPALELAARAAALRERPFPAVVDDALGSFCDAVAAFAATYLTETFPDPLLLGTDWRFFDWEHPEAFEPGAPGRELWEGRATRMQTLAVAVADAYRALVDAASAQPEVRKLIAVRV